MFPAIAARRSAPESPPIGGLGEHSFTLAPFRCTLREISRCLMKSWTRRFPPHSRRSVAAICGLLLFLIAVSHRSSLGATPDGFRINLRPGARVTGWTHVLGTCDPPGPP